VRPAVWRRRFLDRHLPLGGDLLEDSRARGVLPLDADLEPLQLGR